MLLNKMWTGPPWAKIEVTQVQTYSGCSGEHEDGLPGVLGDDRLEHQLDGERHPHQPEEHVGHVVPEVRERAARAGVDPEFRREAVVAAVVDGGIEPAVEHRAALALPVVESGAVVGLGEAVFRTVGPPAVPALVRHADLVAADVTLRHYPPLEGPPAKGLCLSPASITENSRRSLVL